MKKKRIAGPVLAVLLLLGSPFSLPAEEGDSVYRQANEALGAFGTTLGGRLTGLWGLHYLVEGDGLGLHITLTAGYDPNAYAPYDNTFSYGTYLGLFHRVYQDAFADWLSASLYLFAGLLHDGGITPAGSYRAGLGGQFGIGIEPVLIGHLSFPVEFGLGAGWELGSPLPTNGGFTLQGGFRYRY